MTRIESVVANWLAKRIFRFYSPFSRVSQLFAIVRKCAEDEFTEDNRFTVDAWLHECLQAFAPINEVRAEQKA